MHWLPRMYFVHLVRANIALFALRCMYDEAAGHAAAHAEGFFFPSKAFCPECDSILTQHPTAYGSGPEHL